METIRITKAEQFTPELTPIIQGFLKQLSDQPFPFDDQALQELLADSNSHLFLLRINEKTIGMLTVGIYYSPTGGKAWIEDVVVDEGYRGKGYSKLLVAHAIEYVKQCKVPLLMLTSSAQRIAANKLYQRMGFEQKPTNVYRMAPCATGSEPK